MMHVKQPVVVKGTSGISGIHIKAEWLATTLEISIISSLKSSEKGIKAKRIKVRGGAHHQSIIPKALNKREGRNHPSSRPTETS